MHLASFAKSGCNHYKLLQHLVDEPRGQDGSTVVTSTCVLWVSCLGVLPCPLPETAECSLLRWNAINGGTLCALEITQRTSIIIFPLLPAIFCLLTEKKNGGFGRRCWEGPLNNGDVCRMVWCKCLNFCFCPQSLSRMWHKEGIPIKANSRGRS